MKPGAETGLASNAWFRIYRRAEHGADDALAIIFPFV
jgi:hypothetical protein